MQTGKFITAAFTCLFIALMAASCPLRAQQNPNGKTYIAKIGNRDTLVNLNEKFVIQFTDILTLQGKILVPLSDYRFDYREGIVHLSNELFRKYDLDTFQIYNLKIEYDVFPYSIKEEYSNFDILTERDSLTGDTVQIATEKKDFIGSIFEGTDLQKSGSLFRGVNIGSNRDLSLNSGFRLQLNGKLSSDVEINAALTDENTPIQPEGNTEKLQELDNVFIEVKSSNLVGTIGDINVDFANTEFMNFKRKIQGAKGYGDYGAGNIFLSGAVQRGRFSTNTFNGKDGIQGPYVLVGRDNEINILVISGSEKVFLDGNQMTRGEQADYVIDYGIGTITFTNKRLITNASRIIVDFEYSDRKYNRTILAGANQVFFFRNKLSLAAYYVNQNDNPDKTVDFTLTEEDRQILSQAGDDKYKAVKSGVEYVGRDSTGKALGLYVKSDTLLGKKSTVIYKYLPNDSNAVYQITFSFVGQGKGNYVQQSQYQYNFAGISQGNYDTIVFIPMPSAYQVADINLNYESSPAKEFTLNIESAVSSLDANKLSSLGDKGNSGFAINGAAAFSKYNFRMMGVKLSALEFKFRQKVVNKVFEPLERYNPVEFYRDYNIQDTNKLTENLHEASLRLGVSHSAEIKATFGQLLRGDVFNSLRGVGEFSLKNDTLNLPDVKYRVELISGDYSPLNQKSRWLRQTGGIGYRKFLHGNSGEGTSIEFRFDYNQEDRQNKVKGSAGDSLQSGSFSFYELVPGLIVNNLFGFNFYTNFGYRKDNLPVNGMLKEESRAMTQTYGMKYSDLNWLSTLFEMTFRKKNFTDEFTTESNKNGNTLLVNWQTRIDPFNNAMQTDLYYNITSERLAKVEKVFVEVRVGEGNYIYLGDLNGNGIQDENEFQLTTFNDGNYIRINKPTSELFPVTSLNTSARLVLKPDRLLNVNGQNFLADLFRNTTAETYFRTEEKSQDANTSNIYFLHFSTFQNDSNTLFGNALFQQDLNFFEFNPMYSLKLRYIQQRAFNQYVSGNERLLNIQKSIKLKLGLTKDITTQIEYQNITDRNEAPVNSVRNRNIGSDGILTDFSYRPIQEIESGFQLNVLRATDSYSVIATQADINQQILRFIYSFALLGRLQLEVERDEVRLSNSTVSYPYELTNGKIPGKSFLWRAFFDYSISKNLQATFSYDGRTDSGSKVIHTGRAEIKAFF